MTISSSAAYVALGMSLVSMLAPACASDEVSHEVSPQATRPASPQRPEEEVPVSLRELLTHELSHAQEGLEAVPRTDGLEHVRITRGFRHAQVVVRLPDGGLARRCAHDVDEALGLLEHEER